MKIEILPMTRTDIPAFKRDIQEAFQKGFEDVFGESEGVILPEQDIDRSLDAPGSAAYKAVADGETVGGAVVVIDEKTRHNHLDLLYVKYGAQTKGVGFAIWSAIEKRYPETKVWETCTPYIEKRNIHFYVNKCGFKITEFYCEYHREEHDLTEEFKDVNSSGFFRFEKVMKQ